jgi:molybdenum cofactor cytidylyltransferase
MIPAVILAAGASSRMGRPKALLPAGPHHPPFVVVLASTLILGGADDVLIVASAETLQPIRLAIDVAGLTTRFGINPDPARGQLSSVIVGLNILDHPGVRAMLMAPVDLPLVSANTVRAVLEAYRRTGAPVVRPARSGQHGHPVLFDRSLFDELREADQQKGARAVVHKHAARAIDVETADEGAFLDIDTPEDYERAFGSRP